MKVVFDTNIFISAFVVPGGNADRAYALARRGKCELCSSVAILTETAKKLREKFGQEDDDVRDALRAISRTAVVLKPATRIDVLDDKPDKRILECAVEAGADVIVTGDKHLLKLKGFRGIAIVRFSGLSEDVSGRLTAA
jgi:putative PIN family toxin of toxin-antitoxin system